MSTPTPIDAAGADLSVLVEWLACEAVGSRTPDHDRDNYRAAANAITTLRAKLADAEGEIEDMAEASVRLKNAALAMKDCLTTAEARATQAEEAMRRIDAAIYNDNGDVTWSPMEIRGVVRAFLARTEPKEPRQANRDECQCPACLLGIGEHVGPKEPRHGAQKACADMLDRIIASMETMTRPMMLDWLNRERAALSSAPPPPSREGWLDEDTLTDILTDSLDMDWDPRDGAKAILRYLERTRHERS